jgi:sugar/nucleoside kinase (ribokinase family)
VPTQARPDVIVVGDLMVDVSVEAGALARGGDVHGDVRLLPGGSGANAAVWAAAEGARVRFHGRVGNDVPGRILREALAERGVEAAISIDETAPTGAMLVVREAGERTMVAARGANAGLAPEHLPSVLDAEAILVSGYLLYHEGSEPAALAALRRASGTVSVDAASWPLIEAYGRDRFFDATRPATLLFANGREAHALTGRDPEGAARELARTFETVCVKVGPRGAFLASRTRLVHAPAPLVPEIDPTGAGDAFDGAFLSALTAGASPEASLRAGCLAGSMAAASRDLWPAR